METRKQAPLAALAVALMLALSPLGALAEKGGKHNNGKGNNGHKNGNDGGSSVSVEFRFGDSDRRAVQEYYQSPARGKGCPPGLAKKGNGCMPPGQAKKWARGRPLPHDLVVYDLPPDLRYRLPPPPAGHRYVQLGADVLMIAIGTSMVVDAIEDMVR
jgi:Ni/Co efflux regulator RcnB